MRQEVRMIVGPAATGKSSVAEPFIADGHVRINRDTMGGDYDGLMSEYGRVLAVKPSGDWYDLSMTDDRYGGDGRIEWFCAITDGGEPVMFKVISNGKVLSSFEKRDGQPAVILMHRDPHDYRYIFRGPMRSSIDKMVEKVPSREGRK